jgi:hypothetical protein
MLYPSKVPLDLGKHAGRNVTRSIPARDLRQLVNALPQRRHDGGEARTSVQVRIKTARIKTARSDTVGINTVGINTAGINTVRIAPRRSITARIKLIRTTRRLPRHAVS